MIKVTFRADSSVQVVCESKTAAFSVVRDLGRNNVRRGRNQRVSLRYSAIRGVVVLAALRLEENLHNRVNLRPPRSSTLTWKRFTRSKKKASARPRSAWSASTPRTR